MKFKNKLKQQVLEVLKYQDFPKVYGFYQHRKYYLAIWKGENKTLEHWMMVSLDKNDKKSYEELLETKNLKSFLKGKKGFLTSFDKVSLKQVQEKEIKEIKTSLKI